MGRSVTYYLSLASPWTYLGSEVFSRILQEQAAEVQVRPIDLGAIFPKTGGLPLPQRAPERQAYRLVELERWRKLRGLPLNLQPRFFPVSQDKAACLVIAADESGNDALGLAHRLLRAVWAEERNIDDSETLYALATECGLEAAPLLTRSAEPGIAQRFQSYTQEALEAGVFGAPTYLLDGELFWGQDRLDFHEAKLKGGTTSKRA